MMILPSLFEICDLRDDVKKGQVRETDFAADLAQVIRKEADIEYQDPARFFANTHPTRGLRQLLSSVCQRLQGGTEQVGSIFRLDTNYGGGKTHALIALLHTVQGMVGVTNVPEFIDPRWVPKGQVRVAAFDGENADVVNGRFLGDGIYAKTPWGELAYGLAGQAGYERVQASDEQGIAPGAETIRELFGGEPTLILLDELSIYLRKLKAKERERVGGQLTAFLTGLIKAVESSPRAALVFTLAIGKEGKATDAYSDENQFIASKMDELMSVAARKATLLDPTEEDETVKVLRRRLFRSIDDDRAQSVIAAYQQLWNSDRDSLSQATTTPVDQRLEAFQNGFPFHPELIETLRDKTSTLSKFQRVRGMLRLLTRSAAQLWQEQPKNTYAMHLHHLDLGLKSIRDEVVFRLELQSYLPAIRSDVSGTEQDQEALAQSLDRQHYRGLAPYGSFVARVILFHSLAFNESLKGMSTDRLRYSITAPGLDFSFVQDAVRRFVQESAYLDDRPNVPLRFLTEANLTQMIRRQERLIDPEEVRTQLNDRIRGIFKGSVFQLIAFPGGAYDVPDDTNEGKPYLVVMHYEGESVDEMNLQVPALVQRIYREKGNDGNIRLNRNHLVFLCVSADRGEEMRKRMIYRLALRELRRPEALAELAPHQQEKLQELDGKAESAVAVQIQQAYRHLFYPSKAKVEGAEVDLAHATIDHPSAAASPGAGQNQVVQLLREMHQLRLPEDAPDSPDYIRDRTPLKKGEITTQELRQEFYRDPALPMLVGDDVFFKGIREGINSNRFVYRSGDLLWGYGDAAATIKIDANSYVYTVERAKELDIWPRSLVITSPPINTGTGYPPAPFPSPTGQEPGAPWLNGGQTPPPPLSQTFSAEAPLREALTRIWGQARHEKVNRIAQLEIQVFNGTDTFTILGMVKMIQRAEIQVRLEGSYGTKQGSEASLEFTGTIEDALPLKDFLAAQVRAAAESDVSSLFTVNFNEGLDLSGDEPEKLTERLSKLGAGAAHVKATAQGEES